MQASRRLFRSVIQFLRRDEGPTAIEYAVLLALVVVASMASIRALGPVLLTVFQSSADTAGTYGVP